MITENNKDWLLPLMASYIGSIFIYTFSTAEKHVLNILYLIIIFSLLFYSLYIIWKKYEGQKRTSLLISIVVSAVILHAVTLTANYFLQGIIAFLIGMSVIYYFIKKITENYF